MDGALETYWSRSRRAVVAQWSRSGRAVVAQLREFLSDEQEAQSLTGCAKGRHSALEKDSQATRPAGRRTSPGSAVSGLGADEIDQIVRGDDLEVVEGGMSALPVPSGGCRPLEDRRHDVPGERGKAKSSSVAFNTVEAGLGPLRASDVVARLRHLAMVLILRPSRTARALFVSKLS